MNKPKWRFIIDNKTGKVTVEGFDFKGSQCINDIIYKLLEENATMLAAPKRKNSAEEKPVDNVYYVEN